ncbi:carboxypeptidase-like regulatory domain-containing protein, partial [Leeuwenhoekiella blandensis]
MKSKITWCLALGLLFLTQLTFAQQKTVTGTVTDGEGLPLPGVNIVVQGTTNGTQTDFDGNYSINAQVNQVLVFTYVGFEEQQKTVGSASTINVQMTAGEALDEVVVVGYGTRDKTDVVGSVAQVSGDILENRPVANIVDGLQGQVAGLQIFSSSGEPGATPSIRLRGNGSLGAGSTPLILLDGFQVDAAIFTRLNPTDIQDVTVLKDA